MAYVYDKIEDELNQGTQPMGAQGQVAGGGLKTEAGSVDSGQSAKGGQISSAGGDATNRNLAAFQSAKGQIKTPDVFGGIKSQLSGAREKFGQEKQDYQQQATDKDFSVGKETVDKAIAGQGEERQNIASRMGGQLAPRAETFKTTSQGVSDDYLKSETGIGNYLQDVSGPKYSSGEKSFDNMLYGRDVNTQVTRDRLLRDQEDLQKNIADSAQTETQSAQAIYDDAYQKANEDLRSRLTGRTDTIQSGISDRELATEAERRASLADPDAFINAQSTGGFNSIADMIKGANASDLLSVRGDESLQILKDAQAAGIIDPRSFYTAGEVDIDPSSITSQDEADRFNTIMSLLGQGDVLSAGNGPDDIYNFDSSGYQNAMMDNFFTGRSNKDQALLQQQKDIDLAAKARADKINAGRADPQYRTDTEARIQSEALANMEAPAEMEGGIPGVHDFVTYKPKTYGGSDVYTQEDADQLNSIMASLGGMPGNFKSGGGVGDDYNFDEEGYRASLQGRINEIELANRPVTGQPAIESGVPYTQAELDYLSETENQMPGIAGIQPGYRGVEIPGAVTGQAAINTSPGFMSPTPPPEEEVLPDMNWVNDNQYSPFNFGS